jgi:ADP-ribosylglycohydrolase
MLLRTEIIANRIGYELDERVHQGYEVNGLKEEWEKSRTDRDALLKLYDQLQALPIRADWQYIEPSDLEGIQAARPAPYSLPPFYIAELEIQDKIRGAWLGRLVGVTLGKPFEAGLTRAQIRHYLEGADAYPLDNYVPSQSRNGRLLRRDAVQSMRGFVQYAQEDDDVNYMCVALKLLEEHGIEFTTLDVGMNWLHSMPFWWTWGPEHAVYLNLATVVGEHHLDDVDLEAITNYMNPGIEWIGAQIRTDVYGYVGCGNPAFAAELAWRDAYLTHRKTGIYGAMWVAAMNAAAFTLLDMEAIIRAGLAQIPEKSRFAEAILNTIRWVRTDNDWEKTGEHIHEHYGKYGSGGTINNACYVAAALLYGWRDGTDDPATIFERTLTTAVMYGDDTDCNGATAGSLVGVVLGANQLPAKWIAPLNDTLRSAVVGFGQAKISECAERTYQLSRFARWAKGMPKPLVYHLPWANPVG